MRYWLMKSEPSEFSIDDLARVKKELWTGVRNFKARNFMRYDMEIGDVIFFYHSSIKPPGIVGLAKVSAKAIPDPSQFEKSSEYFDPTSRKEKPKWWCVEVSFVKKFEKGLSLEEIKSLSALSDMLVVKRGMRLSVQPVEEKHAKVILAKC